MCDKYCDIDVQRMLAKRIFSDHLFSKFSDHLLFCIIMRCMNYYFPVLLDA